MFASMYLHEVCVCIQGVFIDNEIVIVHNGMHALPDCAHLSFNCVVNVLHIFRRFAPVDPRNSGSIVLIEAL